MMFKNYRFIFFAVLCFVALLSCDDQPKDKKTVTDTPTSGVINISVDESFKPVIEEAIKVYEGSYPDAKIIAHYKPEADCFRDFYSDTSNRMIIVTRGLTSKESRFYTDSLSYTPFSNRVAWDAITIVTNKNSGDTVYTLDDLKQLLTGKKGHSTKVVFDGLNATSTVRFAVDSILHGGSFDTSVVKAVKNSQEVLDYVASNTDAIGFVGISWIGNPEDTAQVHMLTKLKIAYVQCSLCDSTPYVKPMQESINTKRYPLVRGLYYILKENYSGLGSGFAQFLTYERGQLIFRRAYLGPVMDFSLRQVNINQNL
ncbi:PstS family phosphate ABC transporter substrate-binding protein [Ferruginibacter sp.]